MAQDWQVQAVQEQLDIFENLTIPYEKIPSDDLRKLKMTVADIKNSYLKMKTTSTINPRVISAEIIKHSKGEEIKLSFVVIVTNIENNGSLCKMPIFVVMSGGKKIFIDMNLTVFKSWDTFLKNDDLPSCQFCFPVGGQYSVGKKLQIDFASSSSAIRENTNWFWKGLGFVVAVGLVAASFFYEIPPGAYKQADSLLSIANDFVPSIKKYVSFILRGVSVVQNLRRGDTDVLKALPELCKLLTWVYNEFKEEISWVLRKVREALQKIYNWIKHKLSSFFESAPESAQHNFVAVTCRVDTEMMTVESEVEELLEASRKNNQQGQTTVDAGALHAQVDTENDSRYANTIFRNAKTESALESGMKGKGIENLHPVTSDLLSISNSLAKKLGKQTLKDAQDIFEALSCIVKDEFRNKIETYSKMLTAAEAGAGRQINLEVFNKSLGIEGDPKDHYWKEAVMSAMEFRLAYSIKGKIEELEKRKKIFILELWKKAEDDVSGMYRFVGINGAGKFTASDLVKALNDIHIDLNEEILVINETSSMIMIRHEDLTIAAMQDLNPENTSEGMLLIERMET